MSEWYIRCLSEDEMANIWKYIRSVRANPKWDVGRSHLQCLAVDARSDAEKVGGQESKGKSTQMVGSVLVVVAASSSTSKTKESGGQNAYHFIHQHVASGRWCFAE